MSPLRKRSTPTLTSAPPSYSDASSADGRSLDIVQRLRDLQWEDQNDYKYGCNINMKFAYYNII